MKEYIIKIDHDHTEGMQELVRCKDCKYNYYGECIIKKRWVPIKPEWFCADAERRDEETEQTEQK